MTYVLHPLDRAQQHHMHADPETGFSDRHTLGILWSSLALLILPFIGIVVFWIGAGPN